MVHSIIENILFQRNSSFYVVVNSDLFSLALFTWWIWICCKWLRSVRWKWIFWLYVNLHEFRERDYCNLPMRWYFQWLNIPFFCPCNNWYFVCYPRAVMVYHLLCVDFTYLYFTPVFILHLWTLWYSSYCWNYFAQIFLSIPLALTLFLIGISKSKKNGISHRFIFDQSLSWVS